MPGPRRRKPPPHHFEPLVLPEHCEEAYVQDWAKLGLDRLDEYRAKRAAFQDYLAEHHQDDPHNALD